MTQGRRKLVDYLVIAIVLLILGGRIYYWFFVQNRSLPLEPPMLYVTPIFAVGFIAVLYVRHKA